MGKAGAFLFLLLMVFYCFLQPGLLAAQEDNPDWDYYFDDARSWGDQTFTISLGTIFPTVFFNSGRKIDHQLSPPVGGLGSLNYNFFFTPQIFAGAEVGFVFVPTLANNTLFMIPLGLRGGYQFTYGKFEFPVNVVLGVIWHRYLDLGYFGLYGKAGGAVFYRLFSNWSFGICGNWFWAPQWTKVKSENVHGNFADVTLSARYHF